MLTENYWKGVWDTHDFLIIHLNSHNYQALKKKMNCLTSPPAASSKDTQYVTQPSPGKSIQVTNATVCQLFNMCKLCKQGFPLSAGASLFCVSQKQNLFSTLPGGVGLLLKLLQVLALGTGSIRKNAGSTPESSAALGSMRFQYAQHVSEKRRSVLGKLY